MSVKTVTTTAQWTGGTATKIRIGSHEFYMDQTKEQGGSDLGPAPVQYFLAAIAGCLSLVGRLVAKEMGITLNSMEFTTAGDIDFDGFSGKNPEVKSGLKSISVNLKVDSDAESKVLQQWLAVARKRCPVLDNLDNPTALPISVKLLLP
ncbi:MAG: OsmC family protein [Planctomycetota bacterium]|jgi:uncharacterized OsmC-like protein|nr:OsmC family protein [Planctomycetota bacterium]